MNVSVRVGKARFELSVLAGRVATPNSELALTSVTAVRRVAAILDAPKAGSSSVGDDLQVAPDGQLFYENNLFAGVVIVE